MKFNKTLNPLYFTFASIIFLVGCGLFKSHKNNDQDYVVTDTVAAVDAAMSSENSENMEDMEVALPYNATAEKQWELKHTELDLQFNWKEQYVQGTAVLTLRPYFYPQKTLSLDARAMDIIEVSLYQPNYSSVKPELLNFDYSDSEHINITFNNDQLPENTVKIKIQYIANPERVQSNQQVGAPISDEKGIYFINHDLSIPGVPRQLWTQGETRGNRCWFPTIDQPNQKHTQKITMTYPDTMIGISNGYKLSRTAVANKQVKEVWEMKQPHSVYLTMIAIGNWAEITDQYKGKLLHYYVEKSKAASAKTIFGKTPKMIQFFSDYTGIDFPWNKFDQVCVRDFVSGAMENTTAVVHSLNVQDPDYDMEDYISHELFHQWFGDYATAESWSEISMNESFAKYGEYLWLEHEYGKSRADLWMVDNLQNWKSSLKPTPLINYYYDVENDQFDEIRYNKGANILHMLRNYIGDRAFKLCLKEYLTQFAYSNAKASDWQRVIEKVTGKNMSGFFNRWYYHEGNGKIKYNFNFAETNDNTNLVKFGGLEARIVFENQVQNPNPKISSETLPSVKLNVKYKLAEESVERDTSFYVNFSYGKYTETEIRLILNTQKLPEYFIVDPQQELPFDINYDYTNNTDEFDSVFHLKMEPTVWSNYFQNSFKHSNSLYRKIQLFKEYAGYHNTMKGTDKKIYSSNNKIADSLQLLKLATSLYKEKSGMAILMLDLDINLCHNYTSKKVWEFYNSVFTNPEVSEETKAYLALYSGFYKQESGNTDVLISEDAFIEQSKKITKIENYQLLVSGIAKTTSEVSNPKWVEFATTQIKQSTMSENQKLTWLDELIRKIAKINTSTEIYNIIHEAKLNDENTYRMNRHLIESYFTFETTDEGINIINIDGDGIAAVQGLYKLAMDKSDNLLMAALKKSCKDPLDTIQSMSDAGNELSETQRTFRDLCKKIAGQP